MASEKKVAIVGSGLVGKSWAMIFAGAGYQVQIFDIDEERTMKAMDEIKQDLIMYEKGGVLRGKIPIQEQIRLITPSTDLRNVIQDAHYVQECVPESLELKKEVWKEIDGFINSSETICASSTSCIVPSAISKDLHHRGSFIVAHPINPPYLAPLVELVPAPWTNENTKSTTRQIMKEIGQAPVSLGHELPGFALNRLQYALLHESWRLLSDGVLSAEDLDAVVTQGLGLRYAFLGPMETIHLNAEGTYNYVQRYGKSIDAVGASFGENSASWRMESSQGINEVEKISQEMEKLFPLDKLNERRNLRDRKLAALAKLKKEFHQEN